MSGDQNSLPPGKEKASNARGMPGGMLKLRISLLDSKGLKQINIDK